MAVTKGRRWFSAAFKAKVARDALRDAEPVTTIAAWHGVHPNQVRDWRRQAESQIKAAFESAPKAQAEAEATVKDLHAKIGALTMERVFFAAPSGNEPCRSPGQARMGQPREHRPAMPHPGHQPLHELTSGMEANRVIGDWMELHNHVRPHSALGGISPAMAYERKPPPWRKSA